MISAKSLIRSGIALSLTALLAGCKFEVLAPSGDVAARQRDILLTTTWLMLLIIVPVMVMIIAIAWRYRASNRKASYKPEWHHSTMLELGIWGIPLLMIICLGALTWVGTHLTDPYRGLDRLDASRPVPAETRPLEVQVVSLDWKWLFIYPEEGIATINELAVPVDRPVHFTLTSSKVMNAFYIPTMAGMIYTMPAMTTQLNGVINQPGIYDGFSSHYSGAGFSGMRFKAHALSDTDYEAWVEKVRQSGDVLDRARYLTLELPSENEKPAYFGSRDAELFRRIVDLCVEEGRMCMNEMMAIDAAGGMGLAGVMNTSPAPVERADLRRPVFGSAPFYVDGLCTLAEAEASGSLATLRVFDPTPLRGHGVRAPMSLPGDVFRADGEAAASAGQQL